MSKKLLKETQVRRFMGLAGMEANIVSDTINEMYKSYEEEEKDNLHEEEKEEEKEEKEVQTKEEKEWVVPLV